MSATRRAEPRRAALPDPEGLPAARRADAGADAQGRRRRRRGAGARRHASWRSRSGSASRSWSRRRAAARSACACSRTSASAVTYTSDFSPAGARALRARDASSWRSWPSPIRRGDLPAREEMAREVPDLDLWDDGGAVARRRRGRSGARAPARRRRCKLDTRVTNSEGAVFGRTRRRVGVRDLGRVLGLGYAARTCRSSSSRSATTPTARSATASTGPPSRFAAALERPGGGRPRGGAPHGRQARLAQDRRPARCRWSSSPRPARGLLGAARRRDLGRRGLAQVELPRRPRGDAGRLAAGRRSSTIR